MCFSPITPQYEESNWRVHKHLHPLCPRGTVFSAGWIADHIGVSVELVQSIAQGGYRGEKIPEAEQRTEYDEDWKRELTAWHFTMRSLLKFKEIRQTLSKLYVEPLRKAGATVHEIPHILKMIRSVPEAMVFWDPAESAEELLAKYREQSHRDLRQKLKEIDKRGYARLAEVTGKHRSKDVERMLREDINAGEVVCLIDPHGELFTTILKYLNKQELKCRKCRLYEELTYSARSCTIHTLYLDPA